MTSPSHASSTTLPTPPPPRSRLPFDVAAAGTDLAYLAESWPMLVTLKVPGTARSWVERPRRPGVLTAEDVERMGPQGVPRPAPADVAVLDLLWQIQHAADEIVRLLAEVTGTGGTPHRPASVDPRPWLVVAGDLLPAAHAVDDRSAPWVSARLRPMVSTTARLLGDVRDGQALDGVCPWCGGLTERGRGERTMVVRYPDARLGEDEPLIVCRGLGCEPPSSACGQRHSGHPAWPRREWDWLAQQLQPSR